MPNPEDMVAGQGVAPGDPFPGIGEPTPQRAASNTVFLFAAQVFGKLAGLVALAYLARRFSAQGLGGYNLVVAFTGLFALMASLGLQPYLTRELAARPYDVLGLLRSGVMAATASAAVAFVLCNAIAQLTGYQPEVKRWILLSSIGNLFVPATVPLALLAAQLKGRTVASVTTLSYLLGIAASLFVVFARRGIETLIVLQVCIAFIYSAVVLVVSRAWRYIGGHWSKEDVRQALRVLMAAASIGALSLGAVVLSRFDTFILSLFAGNRAIGYYSAAYRLIDALDLIPAAVGATVLPIVASRLGKGRSASVRTVAVGLRYMAMIGMPIMVGTLLLARPLIVGIYGPALHPATPALRVVIVGELFSFFGLIGATTLIAVRGIWTLAKIQLLALTLNAGACLVLIPRFGFMAAAWVSSATTLLDTVLMTGAAVLSLGRPREMLPWRAAIHAALACVPLVGVIVAARHFSAPLLATIAGGAFVYGLALVALREFTSEDLALLLSVVRRAPVTR